MSFFVILSNLLLCSPVNKSMSCQTFFNAAFIILKLGRSTMPVVYISFYRHIINLTIFLKCCSKYALNLKFSTMTQKGTPKAQTNSHRIGLSLDNSEIISNFAYAP